MRLVIVFGVMLLEGVLGDDFPLLVEDPADVIDSLQETELVQVFAIFRHGDRTPESLELALYNPNTPLNDKLYFPYGRKALTNIGKQHAFSVGSYLRGLYDGFISRLYLPDEIFVRTTEFDRTKMTALTALAAMYPPLPSQRWNADLNWQPIPYYTLPANEDDLLYWNNCPRYHWLRNQTYHSPEVQKWLDGHKDFFKYLSEKTGRNITEPKEVFFLYNLFQALNNVEVETPIWAQEVMTKIRDMTNIEYALDFHTNDLQKCSTGVVVDSILKSTKAAINGKDKPAQPKMHIISAHESNVAALMAAVGVFEPHQPHYGATFTLELRKHKLTGDYGITAVYARNVGGPGEILPIPGCDSKVFCQYDTFVNLVKPVAWTKEEMFRECKNFVLK